MSDKSPTPSRPETPGRGSPGRALQVAALLVGSSAAAWWISRVPAEKAARAAGFPLSEAEYAYEPWPLSENAITAIGVSGLVIALVAAALLIRALASGRLPRLPGIAILMLVPLPLMLGYWWTLATAPVIGVNFGVVFAGWLFVPLGLILLTVSVILLLVDRRRQRGQRERGSGASPR